MYRFDKILCLTGLIDIQGLTHMCNIFHTEKLKAFRSPAMHLSGIHYFDNCMFQKGASFISAMTLYLV